MNGPAGININPPTTPPGQIKPVNPAQPPVLARPATVVSNVAQQILGQPVARRLI